MVIFYKKLKKYYETQLTKNKMDLNIRKMTNHPPSPDILNSNCIFRSVKPMKYWKHSSIKTNSIKLTTKLYPEWPRVGLAYPRTRVRARVAAASLAVCSPYSHSLIRGVHRGYCAVFSGE